MWMLGTFLPPRKKKETWMYPTKKRNTIAIYCQSEWLMLWRKLLHSVTLLQVMLSVAKYQSTTELPARCHDLCVHYQASSGISLGACNVVKLLLPLGKFPLQHTSCLISTVMWWAMGEPQQMAPLVSAGVWLLCQLSVPRQWWHTRCCYFSWDSPQACRNSPVLNLVPVKYPDSVTLS